MDKYQKTNFKIIEKTVKYNLYLLMLNDARFYLHTTTTAFNDAL